MLEEVIIKIYSLLQHLLLGEKGFMYQLRNGLVATLVALTTLVGVPAYGQFTSGNLSGVVYDNSGATVPNASVVATNKETNVESSTVSTSAGEYRVANLPVGTYDVSVTAAGFSKSTVANVNIQLNQTVTTNVTLEIGRSATTVEVATSAVSIDTTTAQIQSNFEAKQSADLPIASNGAGVLNLSLLAPGVSAGSTVGAGVGPSVGGQRPRNNNFTIEGIDNNNRSVTGPLVNVPNDDVAEFTLLQNQFSPEFGHSTGGQFNLVVKSGTNQVHGTAYEYFRNRNLNAVDQILANQGQTSVPRYDNNRFGGNFGGPILKNKLFFFAAYEYNPIGQASTPGVKYAPTAAGYAALNNLPGLVQNNLNVLKTYLGTAPSAASPASLPSGHGYPTVLGTSIESGIVPVVAPNYTNFSSGVLSIDYNISDRDQLRGRFINNRTDQIDTAADLPAFYVTTPSRYYLANVSEYHTFSPTVNNELRLGYNRYANTTNAGTLRFPGLGFFPNLTLDEYNVNIGPDPNSPQFTIINTYQVADNLSWNRGQHSFKFGFLGSRYISPQGFTQRQRGDYEWSTLAGYLQDLSPDQFGERSAGASTYYANQWNFGFYGNDDWKVTPNLTLNIGLRYEYWTVPLAENAQALNAVSNVPGLISFGAPKTQKTNFMPRVGFAYSPGTSGTTSFRGGFGIGYDILFDNLGQLSLPPQLQQTNDVNTNAAQTSGFLAGGGLPGSNRALTPSIARQSTGGYIPDVQLPKALQWNLGIQHVFASNYTFEARYLGTRGLNLPVQDRINVRSVVTPTQQLPTYFAAPSQATLDALPLTLSGLTALQGPSGRFLPAFYNAGFRSNITAYQPIGNSIYHGLATQLTRRFTQGLQMDAAYTWSHAIDDSTAEVFSTLTTPRRPQDFQNLRAERSDSALDHRQRATLEIVYDLPFFKNRNWFVKNLVGNWEFAPIYTYQTGNWATVQSNLDSNLNSDSYGDRALVNPAGVDGVGSGVSTLKNSAGAIVGYLATNPNARYVTAGAGVYPNAGRNTLQLPPIQNLDLTAVKRFSLTERVRLELQGQFSNTLNHPQFAGGNINDVGALNVNNVSYTSNNVRSFVNPASSVFNRPSAIFSSNPRVLTLVAKITF